MAKTITWIEDAPEFVQEQIYKHIAGGFTSGNFTYEYEGKMYRLSWSMDLKVNAWEE